MWSSKESIEDGESLDDAVLAHPGAVGTMMVSPGAVKAGLFRRRSDEGGNITPSKGSPSGTGPTCSAGSAATSDDDTHKLCRTPKAVDELLMTVRASADTEHRMKVEKEKLQAKKDELDGEILRLQRDKTEMTEAHRVELTHLRETLEEDARERQRKIKEELEKYHAESMDDLIREVNADKKRSQETTRKRRDGELKGRRGRAEGNKQGAFGRRSIRHSMSIAADIAGSGAVAHSVADVGSSTRNPSDHVDVPFMPQSVGFWQGLMKIFTTHDLLGSNGPRTSIDDWSRRDDGWGNNFENLAPPALLLLAAVPLFCLCRRWRVKHGRIATSRRSDDAQTTNRDVSSSREGWSRRYAMRDQHYGVAQDMEVAEGTAGAAEGVELLPREEEPAKRRCVSSSPNKRVARFDESEPRLHVSLSRLRSRVPQDPGALISPSMFVSKTPRASRRQSTGSRPGLTLASVLPSGREVFSSSTRRSHRRRGESSSSWVDESARRSRDVGQSEHKAQGTADSVSCCSSGQLRPSSPSSSPDRATRTEGCSPRNSQQQRPQPFLQRGRRRKGGRHNMHSVPTDFDASGAVAVAEGAGSPRLVPGARAASCDSSARSLACNSDVTVPATCEPVRGPVLGRDLGLRMRTASEVLDDLRDERDELADTCKRLEAECEASSVRLREGVEHARELEQKRDSLEAEKDVLVARCDKLTAEAVVCAKGECSAAIVSERRVNSLETRLATLEKERDEAKRLLALKESEYAAAQWKIVELESDIAAEAQWKIVEKESDIAAANAKLAAAARDEEDSSLSSDDASSAVSPVAATSLEDVELQTTGKAGAAAQAASSNRESIARRRSIGAHDEPGVQEVKEVSVAQECQMLLAADLMDKLTGCPAEVHWLAEILGAELAAAVAESERASAAATELRQQVAKQEKELSELAAELQDARAAMEAAMKSAGVSVTASLEVARSAERAKIDDKEAYAHTTAELEKAKTELRRMQAESVEQKRLFEDNASKLATATNNVASLEETVAHYERGQLNLENKIEQLREEIGDLEAKRAQLQADAMTSTGERTSELEKLRSRVDSLSSRLESTDAAREQAEMESRGLRDELEARCRELELEKQALSADYEHQLADQQVKLEVNARALEAAVCERQQLEARHAERLEGLEAEVALPPELEEKYAAACENATALAKEKADAEEECSRLRRHALELEEQAAVAMAELKELSTANKCLSQGADESRVLLTVREQGLEALDGKPAADVVASRELLSAVDRARELNKGEAKVLIAAPESDAEEAAAATREARERHAAESDALRERALKLTAEVESLARAKDASEKAAAEAVAEKAKQLSEAMMELKTLEALVEAGKNAMSSLEAQVSKGETRLAEAKASLKEQRATASQASEVSAEELSEARHQLALKEEQVFSLEMIIQNLSAELSELHEIRAVNGGIDREVLSVDEVGQGVRLADTASTTSRAADTFVVDSMSCIEAAEADAQARALDLSEIAKAEGAEEVSELALTVAKVISLSTELRVARTAIAMAEDRSSALEKELSEARVKLNEAAAELQAERNARQLDIATAATELETEKMVASEARARAAELVEEVASGARRIIALQKEGEDIRRKLEALEKSPAMETEDMGNGFEAKDGQLNTALQETEEGCTWSVEEIQCLRDDIEAASANGKKHAVCAQTEKALLSARLAELKIQQSSQRSELERVLCSRDAARERVCRLEDQLDKVTDEVNASAALLEAKEAQLTEVIAERAELATRERGLAELVEELTAQSTRATEELFTLKEDAISNNGRGFFAADSFLRGKAEGFSEGAAQTAHRWSQDAAKQDDGFHERALALRQEAEETIAAKNQEICVLKEEIARATGAPKITEARIASECTSEEDSLGNNANKALPCRRHTLASHIDTTQDTREHASLRLRVWDLEQELDERTAAAARAEERTAELEHSKKDINASVRALREEHAKFLVDVKNRREKAAAQLWLARTERRDAERRCRDLDEEREAMAEDYENRLHKQAADYEDKLADFRATAAEKGVAADAAMAAEVARLKAQAIKADQRREEYSKRLRDNMKRFAANQERFDRALDIEKKEADRLGTMLEDSRRERDAEVSRMQQNIDSLREQLEVKSSTVRHLWEKVAAMRRAQAIGNEELQRMLEDATKKQESLADMVDKKQDEIDRLSRKVKRKEQEIYKTVMTRLKAKGVVDRASDVARDSSTSKLDGDDDDVKCESRLHAELEAIKSECQELEGKCQEYKQQVDCLRTLVEEIAKIEDGLAEAVGEQNWETQSVRSDPSVVSETGLEIPVFPRSVDDMDEVDLRELARWFCSRGGDRRKLLQRYKDGYLAVKKQGAGGASTHAREEESTNDLGPRRSLDSDVESVSTVRSAQSGRSARSVPSARSARSTRSNQSTATTTATVSTVSPIGRLQVEARAQTYARQGQRLFGSTPIRGEQRTRPKASAEGATSQTPPPSFRARTSVSSSRKERSPTGKLRSPRTSSRATGGHS